ncbi:MAG TPA: glycerol-3-phosphate 1-O-acyltransferase PlsY [Aggregatilineales bacterium]|nr:glycerol-3-phosphate 1-O-acyltransferase PlsY [Anaerolineales bacterium]HRE48147.1 glycerol-3-phosphate 1-O-acyltransferase PlsY [Aggregatilineales bacterium]
MNTALIGILIVIALSTYLVGSIPTAYLVGRVNGIDIFSVGSGNMGATNISRTLGFRWGALVLIVDLLKGVAGVLIGRMLGGTYFVLGAFTGGLAVIIGHNWSLFATLITRKIRGGKGAATSAGAWIALVAAWWWLIAGPALMFFAMISLTRYVSLSVLVTGAVAALGGAVAGLQGILPKPYALFGVIMLLLLFYRHRENIQRLLAGTERRVGNQEKPLESSGTAHS